MPVSARLRRKLIQSQKTRRRVLLAQTWWEDRVLRGVADYARQHDWELDCRMRWMHRLQESESVHDGIIVNIGVSESLRRAARPLEEHVRAANCPIVDIQEFTDAFHAPKVIVPQMEVGRLAAQHLIGLGCARIGYVYMERNVLEQTRAEGVRQVVEEAGRKFVEFTPKTLAERLPTLMAATGLCALNDINALQVIRLCIDAGRRVPEEFAVLGADDNDILCDLAEVPLSSVSCDFERQGYAAAELLDRLMDGGAAPVRPVLIAPRGVTQRRSTDSVALPDLDAARMLRFLRDHYRESFSIAQAAELLGVSLRRVQIIFRAHLGWTMVHELTRLRVQAAKLRLLEEKPAKLEVIARECGFSNRFHLVQAFRRITGLSPRGWRAEQV